jgi:methylenetetrahydrofolate reductase (NADPH)
LIQQIREIKGVAGVHVMAYRQEELVSEIIQQSGIMQSRRARERPNAAGQISRYRPSETNR